MGVGQAADAQTELQVVRSQSVFYQALRNVAQAKNDPDLLRDFVKLYLMYDVITPETRAVAQTEGSVATIKVHAFDKRLSEDICREVTEVYNNFRKTNAQNGLQNAIRYLSAQELAAKKSLTESDTKYKEYSAANAIVSMESTSASATSYQSNALAQLQQTKALSQAAEAEASSLEAQMSSVPRNIDSGQTRTVPASIGALEGQLALGRQELERARSRYFEDHPRVQEAAKNVRAMMAQLKIAKEAVLERTAEGTQINPNYQNLQAQYMQMKARADGYRLQVSQAEAAYNEATERMRELPTNEAQLRQLFRDLTLADLNYRRVKVQLDELKSREGNYAQIATVINPARAFEEPVAPDTGKFLFIGAIAGLCLGLIYSFAVESMRLRVHTSQQLAELTGLPVVATIPAMGRGKQKGLRTYTAAGGRPNESFRHMAYTFLAKNHELPRMMMFTGVGSVAGRTSSAVQFALALSNSGQKVLLVDCDPLRALATKGFDAEGRTGLSDIFDRNTLPSEGSDAIMQTAHENLSFLPVGSDPSKSLADRASNQLESIVEQLKSRAEIIVFDVPPCDMFADAARLAGIVDEVCMVVSANTTNYAQIPNGYELLTRAGAKEVSLVLTDASPTEEAFSESPNYAKSN